MATTTHVRIYPADKAQLAELASRLGVSIPDVIRLLLANSSETGTLSKELELLSAKLEQEVDRLENCILRDREEMERIKQWLGEISHWLGKIGQVVGVAVKWHLAEGELPPELFCSEGEGHESKRFTRT